jgi:hypothetical protein
LLAAPPDPFIEAARQALISALPAPAQRPLGRRPWNPRSRLTAWQNWTLQRPNAVGEEGALGRYGSGQKPRFDMTRV